MTDRTIPLPELEVRAVLQALEDAQRLLAFAGAPTGWSDDAIATLRGLLEEPVQPKSEIGHSASSASQASTAPPPDAWMTHHEEPMLFPTRAEAMQYCDDDEEPIALFAAPSRKSADTEGTGRITPDASLASPALSAQPQGEREAFEALLAEYWELAYDEGKTGRSHGSRANEVLASIRASLSESVPVAQDERELTDGQVVELLHAAHSVPWGYRIWSSEAEFDKLARIVRSVWQARASLRASPAQDEREALIREMCEAMRPFSARHNEWRGWPGTWAFANAALSVIEAARAALSTATPPAVSAEARDCDEIAWLVEWDMPMFGTQYWTCDNYERENRGTFSDIKKAVRFARKEDAEKVLQWQRHHDPHGPYRVAEHMWPAMAPPADNKENGNGR